MAKSSRSKWKKMHRRQRAQAEATNTVKRIRLLNKKLELTVKGGISAVPPQEPEKRFHFLNPVLDSRVPNTRKNLNNNYRAELNHVQYDYTKPLKLAPPKTNMYGKTDVDAPHPMTVMYETIDADAPLAGHALTKADMERLARRQAQQEREASAAVADAEEDAGEEDGDNDSGDNADDGPEEYVFGMEDAAPRRTRGQQKTSAKKKGSVAPKALKGAASASAGTSSSVSVAGSSSRMLAAAAAAMANEEEEADHHPRHGGVTAVNKIASMQAMRKKNGAMVSAGGASKMKKVGKLGGSSGTRVVSSGGKVARKDVGNAKNSTKR
ncbi:Nucleotidyltransferase domain containing protein [Leishmania donovani]|uniref:Uncharacterized protein n=3 Tax=Leishmania donovani species complex TaxID=38574 RepID=A4HS44_LEIIN|nr:conserved hypothetical protein [Leishmania infantum JPCM5]CAC9441142.1 hypothetical_protein_-_conserved [Leishmania infantum]CAJ1985894.1 Nucleotidyltransferase domain containing protein [Leishmania donovani]CAM65072.1 conserved hypothetical protein [Leishmania infantum JPCM5]SUZ38845.1 hypothetical_protein_-_conserved [Leishmania infantum]VDZ41797.1 Nucleotidyltransferase_domain_containing_protein_putative/Pfam:PF01909 [Leishmania donovani]|eukprot:XP_001462886.1 conserved hypothetical protein [Leishmania infantum JPCM5]